MLDLVTFGNAARDGAKNRQWFIGPFLDEPAGGRRTGHLEVKWASHPRGQRRESWAPAGGMTSVSILIRGRFRIDFRDQADPPQLRSVLLEAEGDYALWTPEIEHTWEAEEDSVVATVRWREPARTDPFPPPP
jgi:hypothetical protein